jgi:hypothetical protein
LVKLLGSNAPYAPNEEELKVEKLQNTCNNYKTTGVTIQIQAGFSRFREGISEIDEGIHKIGEGIVLI